MGTLGQYLSSARELKGFDLHDAAQQTRIGIQYLKALEQEDFAKLPGEVFVRGFLKNYAKFLGLPEQEVLKKYGELRHPAMGAAVAAPQPATVAAAEPAPAPQQARERSSLVSLEPWLWGTVIFISILGFLFMGKPEKQPEPAVPLDAHSAVLHTEGTGSSPAKKGEKLYLQIVALEDVWLLVRTDAGPQKKAVLKKNDDVVWIADDRFLLSFGSVGAVKLLLNGEELTVTGQKNAVVRDLEITAAGITSAKAAPVPPRAAKPRKPVLPKPDQPAGIQTPAPPTTPQPVSPQPQDAPVVPPAAEKPAPPPAAVVSPDAGTLSQ